MANMLRVTRITRIGPTHADGGPGKQKGHLRTSHFYRPHPKDEGGNIFSLFTLAGGGGTPSQVCGWGGPHLRSGGGGTPSKVWVGGYPIPSLDHRVPNFRSGGGVPCPRSGWGVPHTRSGPWGTPFQVWWGGTLSQVWVGGGTPSQVWTGNTPSQVWTGGYPIPGLDRGTQGTPLARSGWWGVPWVPP